MNKYTLNDLEVDLWEVCNLRCSQCTHASPFFTNDDERYSYESFERDLKKLNEIAHVKAFRVIGGEPLLNKNLLSFLKLIKSVDICDRLALFTNGLLLNFVDQGIFTCIDRLGVCVYNLNDYDLKTIEINVRTVKEKFPNLDIVTNRLGYFSKYHIVEKNNDENLVKKIYDNCYYSWGHSGVSMFNGRIYRCPMSRKKYKYLKSHQSLVKDGFDYLKSSTQDSIELNDSLTPEMLNEFLDKNTPLEGCKWCLGSSGKPFKHHQLKIGEPDAATLDDLDFEESRIYLSNYLLSWSLQSKDGDKINDLKNNKYFNPDYIKHYARYFKTRCFVDKDNKQ